METGVTSLIAVTSKPADCNARIADSRPGPGPFTVTSTVLNHVPLQILKQFQKPFELRMVLIFRSFET